MKLKYEDIYSFQVIGKLQAGESVYMVDKKSLTCGLVGDMTVYQLIGVLEEAEKQTGRFCFWIEVREEE